MCAPISLLDWEQSALFKKKSRSWRGMRPNSSHPGVKTEQKWKPHSLPAPSCKTKHRQNLLLPGDRTVSSDRFPISSWKGPFLPKRHLCIRFLALCFDTMERHISLPTTFAQFARGFNEVLEDFAGYDIPPEMC